VVRAEEDDVDDDPRGLLVISGDIVDQCAAVRAAGAPSSAEPMAWLAILRGVASCLETGELQQRHIVLRGPSRPQVIMKYIFTRLGVRVPAVVVSPWIERGSTFDWTFDHTSILKLIEWRWNLRPLTARDASSDVENLATVLDFANPNATVPSLPMPAEPFIIPCILQTEPPPSEWDVLLDLFLSRTSTP